MPSARSPLGIFSLRWHFCFLPWSTPETARAPSRPTAAAHPWLGHRSLRHRPWTAQRRFG